MSNYESAVAFKRSEYSASAESVYFGKVTPVFNPKNCAEDLPCIYCPSYCLCNGIE